MCKGRHLNTEFSSLSHEVTIGNDRIAMILSSIGDGVISIDIDSNIEYMNQAAQEILGLEAPEAIGKPISEVFKLFDSITGEQYSSPTEEALRTKDKVGLKNNTILLSSDGLYKFVSASCTPALDVKREVSGAVIVFRDITRLKGMEDQLHIERNNLQRIIDAAPVGMMILDHKLAIQQVNNNFITMMNYNPETIVGKVFGDEVRCLNSFDKGCGSGFRCSFCTLRQNINKILQSSPKDTLTSVDDFPLEDGTGKTIWFKINAVPLMIQGGIHVLITFTDISDQKQRELHLMQAKDFFLRIMDNFPAMVWTAAPNLNIDYLNKPWFEFTGLTIETATSETLLSTIHPKDREQCTNILINSTEAHQPFEMEHRMKNREGEYHWVVTVGKPHFNTDGQFSGYIGAVYDITDRKKIEKAVQQSEQKFKNLFHKADDAIYLHELTDDGDELSNIVEINDTACKRLEYEREEILGKSPLKLYTSEYHTVKRTLLAKIMIQGSIIYEAMHITKSGKAVPVEVRSHYFEMDNKRFVLSVARDMTERKRVEAQLLEAKEQAETANKSKSEFLANMSHEIRTPLNGIVGMVDLTLATNLNEDQRENLDTAKACAKSLMKIINDILDFSKMEAGKLSMEAIDFNVRGELEEILKAHSFHAASKQMAIRSDVAEEVPEYLQGDPYRLKQILNNLINNAIKFTNSGCITVAINQVKKAEDRHVLQFSITDTGIGISVEDQNKLFKSFSQVDSTFTKKFGGTGLGLVISKQLAEMMGGTMWVESTQGEGSTFFFTIECRVGKKPVESRPLDIDVIQPRKIRKVLIAEDYQVNQMVLKKILIQIGYEPDIASNGYEAIQMHEENTYDAILMDVQMPIMDGVEATKQIRAMQGPKKDIPIIAVTAFALDGDLDKFIHEGMDYYISKPVMAGDLTKILANIQSKNQQTIKGFTERVKIDENGELMFVNESEFSRHEDYEDVIHKIAEHMSLVYQGITDGKLIEIEHQADEIKKLSEQIEADEFKRLSFKIQLAARRGNLQDIVEYATRLGLEIEKSKKRFIGGDFN
ncbi:hypothetical protein BHU72_06670 [Desulfuribacillus stibiiarsenatis]|uniref:Circadian input-output histidine kinase CikA n=1 Tax=Desulfuribacillus stibiiarsenatis TaxID=1390249 RepID=A0A1E5L409_9FIRM|nr:PAS domain S-box protein [Desulfuribacillus stibiiarsenatis]OEH84872.1 hypothetical protein BHU72_06670 [Desulfuribacillus stibiiarsenatis]